MGRPNTRKASAAPRTPATPMSRPRSTSTSCRNRANKGETEMTGPGSGDEDYPAALDLMLNSFESALVDRWHQTIHDAVISADYIPPALHIYQNRYASGVVWDHRRPEVL